MLLLLGDTRALFSHLLKVNPLEFPWPLKAHGQYEEACRKCEVVVDATWQQYKKVKASLEYFGAASGPRGRALVCDIPELGLAKRDRLEPCASVPDTGEGFDKLSFEGTHRLVFWRRSEETLTRHRNPLLQEGSGITLETLAFDLLHTWFLGVAQTFCVHVVHTLIHLDAWSTKMRSKEALYLHSCMRIRQSLQAHYREARREHPNLTEVQDFTPGMIGTWESPVYKLKAAETAHFLPFCVGLCKTFAGLLGDNARGYDRAGTSLSGMLALLKSSPRVLSPTVVQQVHTQLVVFYRACLAIEVPMQFKFHMMAHIVHASSTLGNPWHCSTFEDEAYNGKLVPIAASAHRAVWHARTLVGFRQAFGDAAPKRFGKRKSVPS